MGLIINTKIKQLLKGYPTVSDKYNVAGGTNTDENPMEFGEVVKYGEQTGYYKKFDATPAAGEVAGICMAKNVKLVNFYPADGKQAQIMPGEAIDLFVDGYIAVELASAMVTVADPTKPEEYTVNAAIKEGADAYLVFDTDAVKFTATQSDNEVAYGKFTGIVEYNYGKYLAEIVVK